MRGPSSKCRQAKRCLLFFLAIALLPLLVIYFLINDQMRHVPHMNNVSNNKAPPIYRTKHNKLCIVFVCVCSRPDITTTESKDCRRTRKQAIRSRDRGDANKQIASSGVVRRPRV